MTADASQSPLHLISGAGLAEGGILGKGLGNLTPPEPGNEMGDKGIRGALMGLTGKILSPIGGALMSKAITPAWNAAKGVIGKAGRFVGMGGAGVAETAAAGITASETVATAAVAGTVAEGAAVAGGVIAGGGILATVGTGLLFTGVCLATAGGVDLAFRKFGAPLISFGAKAVGLNGVSSYMDEVSKAPGLFTSLKGFITEGYALLESKLHGAVPDMGPKKENGNGTAGALKYGRKREDVKYPSETDNSAQTENMGLPTEKQSTLAGSSRTMPRRAAGGKTDDLVR